MFIPLARGSKNKNLSLIPPKILLNAFRPIFDKTKDTLKEEEGSRRFILVLMALYIELIFQVHLRISIFLLKFQRKHGVGIIE